MSKVDVKVAHIRTADAAGSAADMLEVTASNLADWPITLIGCAVVLPFGLRIYSDPPQPAYPLKLDTGSWCCDRIDCRAVAKLARASAGSGKLQLTAMFLEAGGFDESFAFVLPSPMRSAGGVEHRSSPFVFDVERWL
jgi:hypothetical protein